MRLQRRMKAGRAADDVTCAGWELLRRRPCHCHLLVSVHPFRWLFACLKEWAVAVSFEDDAGISLAFVVAGPLGSASGPVAASSLCHSP